MSAYGTDENWSDRVIYHRIQRQRVIYHHIQKQLIRRTTLTVPVRHPEEEEDALLLLVPVRHPEEEEDAQLLLPLFLRENHESFFVCTRWKPDTAPVFLPDHIAGDSIAFSRWISSSWSRGRLGNAPGYPASHQMDLQVPLHLVSPYPCMHVIDIAII